MNDRKDYIKLEEELAEALGLGNCRGTLTSHAGKAHCLDLMVEHKCYPTEFEGHVGVMYAHLPDGSPVSIASRIADHPDKDTAVRYVIVVAVIKKLQLIAEDKLR